MRLPNSSHRPTPPRNFSHPSSDLLVQIELSVPTFHFRGKRVKWAEFFCTEEEIPPLRCSKLLYLLFVAFHLLLTGKLTVKPLRPSGELKQNQSGSVYQCPGRAFILPSFVCRLLFNWLIFLTHIKGKISLRNITQHSNELLSLSDSVAGWRQ